MLYINDKKEGTVLGYLSSDVSGGGDTGTVYLSALVNNGNGKEQVATNSTLSWLSPAPVSSSSSSWAAAGNVSVVSVFRMIDLVDWDPQGKFQYSEDRYSVVVSDHSQSGRQIFLTEGNGQYGGNWSNW